jgi:Tol biopolymer transport system component
VWAIGPDGSNERPITPTGTDSRLEYLTLSPDGRYLAFVLNAVELDVVDLQQGIMTTLDTVEAGFLGSLAWSPDSATLYYHRLTLDAATSQPSRSAVMRSAVPLAGGGPAAVVESDLATGPLIYPGFVLDGQMLVQQITAPAGWVGEWFALDLATAAQTPVQTGFAVADASPDGSRLLLFRQEDVSLGGAVPIYVADFSPGGALNPVQLSPVGETAAYSSPRYGPDGSRILAIRRDLAQEGAPAPVALLAPNENGSYVVTPLTGLDSFNVVAFVWNGPNGLVAQGIPVDGTVPELWVMSLDGSTPAARLTAGEFPLVVPAP